MQRGGVSPHIATTRQSHTGISLKWLIASFHPLHLDLLLLPKGLVESVFGPFVLPELQQYLHMLCQWRCEVVRCVSTKTGHAAVVPPYKPRGKRLSQKRL